MAVNEGTTLHVRERHSFDFHGRKLTPAYRSWIELRAADGGTLALHTIIAVEDQRFEPGPSEMIAGLSMALVQLGEMWMPGAPKAMLLRVLGQHLDEAAEAYRAAPATRPS